MQCPPCSPVDITVYHGGFHGDLNETMFVGKVDDASKKLVQTAHECMMNGIAIGMTLYVAFINHSYVCKNGLMKHTTLQSISV